MVYNKYFSFKLGKVATVFIIFENCSFTFTHTKYDEIMAKTQ